jgi:hypothetical protein
MTLSVATKCQVYCTTEMFWSSKKSKMGLLPTRYIIIEVSE